MRSRQTSRAKVWPAVGHGTSSTSSGTTALVVEKASRTYNEVSSLPGALSGIRPRPPAA